MLVTRARLRCFSINLDASACEALQGRLTSRHLDDRTPKHSRLQAPIEKCKGIRRGTAHALKRWPRGGRSRLRADQKKKIFCVDKSYTVCIMGAEPEKLSQVSEASLATKPNVKERYSEIHMKILNLRAGILS